MSSPGRTRTRTRFAAWSRVAAVNIAVFAGLMVVVELALGSWLSGQSLGALNVRANVDLRIVDSPFYPPGTVEHYRRDRYGLRGDYGGEPTRITLLTVGGSTTNERAVGEGGTWSDVMQRGLREAGKAVTVANAGVDGHSTAGHIRSFEIWFPKIPGLAPRHVLFYIGVNERGVAPDAVAGPDALVHATAWRRIATYIENNSVVAQAVRVARGWFAARRIGVHYGMGKAEAAASKWQLARLPPGLSERLRPNIAAYGRRLRMLHEKVKEFGATPIYVTQINGDGRQGPQGVEEIEGSGGGAVFAELSLYNAELLRFCAEVSAACIDLARELRFLPGDFYDSIHTTPQGSARIGNYLAGKLRSILP